MNFLTHFLSFVCASESKVPRHAFLGAIKKNNGIIILKNQISATES